MSIGSVRSGRRTFGGGPPCRVVEIRSDRLEVHRVQAPSRVRARDAAHILALQTGMSAEALALPSFAVRAASAPAALRRHGSDTYPTLRSALSAWSARTDPVAREAVLANGTGEVGRYVRGLRRRGLIAWRRHLRDGEPPLRPACIGTLGYLRQLGHVLPGTLLLNTHFFVYDPRELDGPLAAIGDPVGMLASGGQIRVPPILRRATLLRVGGRWQVQHLGIDDVAIDLPDGTTLAPGTSEGVTFRYRGSTAEPPRGPAARGTSESGRATMDSTAEAPAAACEICLQGRHVSAIRMGGALEIPHGALVLSFVRAPSPDLLAALVARPTVRYRIPRIPDLTTALQAGPELLRDGEPVIRDASFLEERFRTLGTPDPTAPLDFPANAARTRAARVGIGVTHANELVIVAVEGTSSLSDRGPDSPTGCTLHELARLLAEAGAVDALNCDGGGSAQVFAGPGVLLASSDARAVPGALFDRPVPVAAALR